MEGFNLRPDVTFLIANSLITICLHHYAPLDDKEIFIITQF